MTTSSVQNPLISAACIAGTVFALSTVPLAMFSSKVVSIELQNRPLFSTELRDLAGPYLGVAGAISASIGFGVLGLSGWRQAAHKSTAAESQLSGLQRDLQANQLKLEELKFSEAKLRAQHLDAFLDTSSSVQESVPSRAPLAAVPNTPTAGSALGHSVSFQKPQVVSVNNSVEAPAMNYAVAYGQQQLVEAANSVKDRAMMALSAAQSYASYNRSSATPVAAVNESAVTNPGGTQLDQLLKQLRELTNQVEELRTTSSDGMAA